MASLSGSPEELWKPRAITQYSKDLLAIPPPQNRRQGVIIAVRSVADTTDPGPKRLAPIHRARSDGLGMLGLVRVQSDHVRTKEVVDYRVTPDGIVRIEQVHFEEAIEPVVAQMSDLRTSERLPLRYEQGATFVVPISSIWLRLRMDVGSKRDHTHRCEAQDLAARHECDVRQRAIVIGCMGGYQWSIGIANNEVGQSDAVQAVRPANARNTNRRHAACTVAMTRATFPSTISARSPWSWTQSWRPATLHWKRAIGIGGPPGGMNYFPLA